MRTEQRLFACLHASGLVGFGMIMTKHVQHAVHDEQRQFVVQTAVVVGGIGSGDREAVCTTSTFFNKIPDGVLEAEERRSHTWIITGMETPADGDREGVPIVWRTEEFRLGGDDQ